MTQVSNRLITLPGFLPDASRKIKLRNLPNGEPSSNAPAKSQGTWTKDKVTSGPHSNGDLHAGLPGMPRFPKTALLISDLKENFLGHQIATAGDDRGAIRGSLDSTRQAR